MTKLGQESGQNGAGGHVTWSRGDGLRSRDDGLFSFYRRGIVLHTTLLQFELESRCG